MAQAPPLTAILHGSFGAYRKDGQGWTIPADVPGIGFKRVRTDVRIVCGLAFVALPSRIATLGLTGWSEFRMSWLYPYGIPVYFHLYRIDAQVLDDLLNPDLSHMSANSLDLPLGGAPPPAAGGVAKL